MSKKISGDELAVGGQAVIEGVLMQSKTHYSVSVLNPEGKIVNQTKKKKKPGKVSKFFRKIPFIRGNFALVDSLKIGYKALNYSAEISTGEKEETSGWMGFLMIVFSIAFAILLFKFLPYITPSFFLDKSSKYYTLVEGLVKTLIFIGYILAISLSKDIRRVFQFHGAEHKAVHCYEELGDVKKLTPRRAQKCNRIHKRCGTTFLFLVILMSIIVYTFLPKWNFWASFGLRLLFLPVIAGISFEILKVVPKMSNYNPLKWVLLIIEYPGLLIQRLTTREPDLKQLEVAIDALKKVV